MPRTARASLGGYCYHVLNRGNARRRVFHKDADYEAFLTAMANAHEQLPMRVLGYCLMPNHFHLVLWPIEDGDLSKWMHWLMNAHVRRYHKHHKSSGHLWQGRFKAFPIAEDDYLLTALRYVERNALRARLAARAEQWRWCSAPWWQPGAIRPRFAHRGPVRRGKNWLEWVNTTPPEQEIAEIRKSLDRGRPLGNEKWVKQTAARMDLESTLRPRGRPKKEE